MKRKIVSIDEEKYNGCGECIPNCAEEAIKIVDGKAKLLDDKFCDGLGACLGYMQWISEASEVQMPDLQRRRNQN